MLNTALRLTRYAIIAGCAAAVLLIVWRTGIGYTSDSFAFLENAEALAADGLNAEAEYLTHFPPLYPIILAMLGNNTDLILGYNLMLIALILWTLARLLDAAKISRWLVPGVLVIVGLSQATLYQHTLIMSDTLFVLLALLTVLAMAYKRPGWAMFFAAMGALDRYAGVALIGFGALWFALHREYRQALIFAVASTVPLVLWILFSLFIAETPGRDFAMHFPSIRHVARAVFVLSVWFAPVTLVMALALLRKPVSVRATLRSTLPVVRMAALFIVVYAAFLVTSITFFDFDTPLDSRVLLPVLPLGWVIAAWTFDHLLATRPPVLRILMAGLFVLVVASYAAWGAYQTVLFTRNGTGLGADIKPGHFEVLNALPPGTTIYTNHARKIEWMYTVAPDMDPNTFVWLPDHYDRMTRRDNPDYDEATEAMFAALDAGEAVVIWFHGIDRDNLISHDDLDARLLHRDLYGLRLFFTEAGAFAVP